MQRLPPFMFGVPIAIVRELAGDSFGMKMDIEVLFRDIDANGDFVTRLCYRVAHLFLSLACHAGLVPRYPFGPQGKERGDQTLTRSCQTSVITIRPLSPSAGGDPPMVNHIPRKPGRRHKTSVIDQK